MRRPPSLLAVPGAVVALLALTAPTARAQNSTFEIRPGPVVVGSAGDFTLVARGPLLHGDVVHWRFGDALASTGWTPPQTTDPQGPGYVESLDTEIALSVVVPPRGRDVEVWMTVVAPVAAGQEVRGLLHRARAGLVAHQRSVEVSLWRSGGSVQVLWVPLAADPGPATRVHLVLPSLAAPGTPLRLRAAALDEHDNAASADTTDMPVEVVDLETGVVVARNGIALHGGRGSTVLPGLPAGAYAARLGSGAALPGVSNPVLVDSRAASLPPILWGDTHVHGEWSLDALSITWTELGEYARDVAFLDFLVATDHDSHLAMQPDSFAATRLDLEAVETPEFTAFPGYEWTSGGPALDLQSLRNPHAWGHRTLLFRDPTEAVLLSSRSPGSDDLVELLQGLELAAPGGFLAIPHHLGRPALRQWRRGGPWWGPIQGLSTALLRRHGGVAEIYSGLGPQESRVADDPWRKGPAPWEDRIVAAGLPTRRYRDACAEGAAWGVVGSSDGHRGYPGLGVDRVTVRGLTAVFASHGHGPIFDAIAARHSYAASARMAILAALDGVPMGGQVVADADLRRLQVDVAGTAPIQRLVLVVDGRDAREWRPPLPGAQVLRVDELLPGAPGVWYLRVEQEGTPEFPDGERGWSSPWLLVP